MSTRVKSQLKSKACSEFVEGIHGSKKFSDKWPDDRRRQLGQVKQRFVTMSKVISMLTQCCS